MEKDEKEEKKGRGEEEKKGRGEEEKKGGHQVEEWERRR